VAYSIQIKGSASRALQRVGRHDRLRLIEAIDRLREEPFAGGVLKGEFSGLRRLRVGDYRIVYEVVQARLFILVVRVAHRSRAYHR
jgi:mRNA interferase RelE/StbE